MPRRRQSVLMSSSRGCVRVAPTRDAALSPDDSVRSVAPFNSRCVPVGRVVPRTAEAVVASATPGASEVVVVLSTLAGACWRLRATEAASVGFYEHKTNQKKYPRLQLRTVKELMAGRGIERPTSAAALDATFKKAPSAKQKSAAEPALPGLA